MKREMWQCPLCRWWNVGHFGACTSCQVVNPAVSHLLEVAQCSNEGDRDDEFAETMLANAS